MTSRAFLLLGFLIVLLVSVSAAHAETIPATSTETVVTPDYAYYKFSDAVPGYSDCVPECTRFPSRNSMGNAAAAADWGNGRTYTYNAGNTTPDPTSPSGSQSIYIWLDDNLGSSRGVYGSKVWGSCTTGATYNGTSCATYTYTCPSNQGWTLDGQSCTRPDCPYVRNPDGTCAGQCDGKTASGAPDAIPQALYKATSVPKITCVNGCVATASTVIEIGGSNSYDSIVKIENGVKVNYINVVYDYADDGTGQGSGVACSAVSSSLANSTPPTGVSNPDQIQQSCGSGQTGAYVNGKYTCVSNTTSEQTAQETVAKPQTTTTNTVTNPDGSTTTTKTTTYSDGSKTIETTATPSGGGSPSTTTTQHLDADGKPVSNATAGGGSGSGQTNTANVKDGVKQGLDQYCTENPNSGLCKEEGDKTASGGTGCDVPPTCSGDAIQCAVLHQQWKNRCETAKLNEALGEGSALANELAGVGETAMTGDPLDRTSITDTIDVSGQISTEKFLSGGCIPDKVISGLPMGKTMTIPFTLICPYIEYFGFAMIALAMLGAARITGVF